MNKQNVLRIEDLKPSEYRSEIVYFDDLLKLTYPNWSPSWWRGQLVEKRLTLRQRLQGLAWGVTYKGIDFLPPHPLPLTTPLFTTAGPKPTWAELMRSLFIDGEHVLARS